MMRSTQIVGVCVLLLLGCSPSGGTLPDQSAPDEVTFVSFATVVDGDTRPAALYVPADYDPGVDWPLIVFMHGSGERGNDGLRQTHVGLGDAIRENPERFPCLVLFPQCASTTKFAAPTHDNGAVAADHVDAALAHVIANYAVDEQAITLTGMSMGGEGAFVYGAANVGRLAAILAIGGRGHVEDAPTLAALTVRIFHGTADLLVPVAFSREIAAALEAAGGDVLLTEYAGAGHNIWDRTYADEEVVNWLLAQRR